jgi:hypothetical protein
MGESKGYCAVSKYFEVEDVSLRSGLLVPLSKGSLIVQDT